MAYSPLKNQGCWSAFICEYCMKHFLRKLLTPRKTSWLHSIIQERSSIRFSYIGRNTEGKTLLWKKNAHALLSFKGKLTFPSAFILLLPACWYKKLSLFFGENSSSHVASEAVEASLLPTLGSVQEMFHYLHPLFLLPEGGEKAKNIFNNSDTFQPLLRQLFSRQILWISATVEEDPEPLAAASMICRRPKSLFLGYSGSLYLTSRILYVFCEGFIVHFHLEKSTTLKYTELQFMIDEMDLFFSTFKEPQISLQRLSQNAKSRLLTLHVFCSISEMHLIMTGVVWRTQCQWWQITLQRLPRARARAKRSPTHSLQVQPPRPHPRPPRVAKTLRVPTTTSKPAMTAVVEVAFFDLWWSWLCPVSTFSEGSVNTRDYLKTRPKTDWKWSWSGLTTKSWVSYVLTRRWLASFAYSRMKRPVKIALC